MLIRCIVSKLHIPQAVRQACCTGPPDITLRCSNVWHTRALNKRSLRTDQNFMQDKLGEWSVLGLFEHGTVASTMPTFSW